jgi:hypothetical protein
MTTRLDGLTEDGDRFVPAQSTTVAEQKLAPDIVTGRAPAPAVADEGLNPLTDGGTEEGARMVKLKASVVPGMQPMTFGLTTLTGTTPGVVTCAAGTVTLMVLFEKGEFGVRMTLPQLTVDWGQKLPPVRVSVTPTPAAVEVGLRLESVGRSVRIVVWLWRRSTVHVGLPATTRPMRTSRSTCNVTLSETRYCVPWIGAGSSVSPLLICDRVSVATSKSQ